MPDNKYDRSISMQCPTCGGTDFESDDSPEIRCGQCDRTMTKHELREANGERIQAEVEDVKAEIMKDIKKDFSKMFKKWK
jgi:ribosomal protein S27AE